jgi:hypothetical protein
LVNFGFILCRSQPFYRKKLARGSFFCEEDLASVGVESGKKKRRSSNGAE